MSRPYFGIALDTSRSFITKLEMKYNGFPSKQ